MRTAARVLVVVWVAAWVVSCGGDGTACEDRDLDGFGVGCAAGPDCDDTNPLRTDDCDTVPPPDCAADPHATGCPCLGGVVLCYPGPAGTEGVGECRAGGTTCVNGHWGLCVGAVVPSFERCDGLDQSCDGVADEGVKSPCGGCDSTCVGGVWGEADAPFTPGVDTVVLPAGELTLARTRLDAPTVWVANRGDDTLSRIDAATATEVARYDTGGAGPNRVAVDYDGDAWVTNRAFGGVSSVTKVVSDPSRCVDADGDGLETSSGPTDVLPRGSDECVAFTVPVGGVDDVARAIAIDGARSADGTLGGNVWVGLERGQAVVELDGRTGAELDRLDTPGFGPFDAAFDPWGVLWMISRDGRLARVDRRVRPLEADVRLVPYPCYLAYGLSIDSVGRLVLSGLSCDQVRTYDPARDRWAAVDTPQSPRGVAVGEDGTAWVAHADGRVSLVSVEPPVLDDTVDLTDLGVMPVESIGVGLDTLGGVWVASAQGGAGGAGVVTRLDADTGAVTDQVTVGLAPHVQGDLTGAERLGGFVAEGAATHVFDGCDAVPGTQWSELYLEADPGASGEVEVQVRRAASRDDLASVPFVPVLDFPAEAPPARLDVPDGGVLEVRLVLRSPDRDGAPRVRRVGVRWSCPLG